MERRREDSRSLCKPLDVSLSHRNLNHEGLGELTGRVDVVWRGAEVSLVPDNSRGVRRVSSNIHEGGIRSRGWPKCSLRAGIFTRSRGQKQRGRSPSRISVASGRGHRKGGARRGDNVSRALCAHCAVFHSLLHRHTSADTRAGREEEMLGEHPEGIPRVWMPRTLCPSSLLVIARSPPLSLTISRTPAPPSYPLFLSFNLRLDCRLHTPSLHPRSLSQLPFGLLSSISLSLSLSLSPCYLMHTFSTVNFFLVTSFSFLFFLLIQLFRREIAEI